MSDFELERLEVGPLGANCYLICNLKTQEAVIIDPGGDPDFISQKLIDMDLSPVAIVATHGHFDHVLGAFALQINYKIPFLMSKKDEFLLNRQESTVSHFLGYKYDPPAEITKDLKDEKRFSLASFEIEIIKTPGHTPGSISLYIKAAETVLVGDLLFKDGAVGRIDFGYSNQSKLTSSINKILSLPIHTKIYSGHGEVTSVEQEKGYHSK